MRWMIICFIVFALLVEIPYFTDTSSAKFTSSVAYECEGDACAQVTLTWDNDRQQFRAQNNSDRQVKVEVTTFAGGSMIRIAPHKAEYLQVKTFNGAYRANYE